MIQQRAGETSLGGEEFNVLNSLLVSRELGLAAHPDLLASSSSHGRLDPILQFLRHVGMQLLGVVVVVVLQTEDLVQFEDQAGAVRVKAVVGIGLAAGAELGQIKLAELSFCGSGAGGAVQAVLRLCSVGFQVGGERILKVTKKSGNR